MNNRTNKFEESEKKTWETWGSVLIWSFWQKKHVFVLVAERHSESSFWICIKKPSATSHTGTDVVTLVFEVQDRRSEAARDTEWHAKSNPCKHCTPSLFPCSAETLPLPRSITWFSFPTGNSNLFFIEQSKVLRWSEIKSI